MPYTLQLAQKLTVMKNVWHLSRTDGAPVELGTIEQARMKLKEQVTCKAADGSGVLFTIKARRIVELAATYDVTAGDGSPIGTIAKDFRASLGRSTYLVETDAGTWTVTETSSSKAIARRIVGMLTDLPWPFRVQFSILDATGRPVGHVNRANMKLRDTYEIRVEHDALDQRMAAAIGVAVDAFMNR
ncbi:MAG: hypothetical protein EBU70_03915 [Actinobacteria bacterium]|nr:hypothetical protein [Actinomycetota bacterium]